MTDDRTALATAVDRLESITARLGEGDVGADELKRLAEDALAASAQVSELLPRVIRQIERASEGAVSEEPDPGPM